MNVLMADGHARYQTAVQMWPDVMRAVASACRWRGVEFFLGIHRKLLSAPVKVLCGEAAAKHLRNRTTLYLNEVVMSSSLSTVAFFTNLEFAIRSFRVDSYAAESSGSSTVTSLTCE